jgi:hypothetical protein
MGSTTGVLLEAAAAYPSRAPEFTPFSLVGSVLLIFFVCFLLCCPIMCLYVLSSMLYCTLQFSHKNYVQFVFISSCLYEGSCLISSYLRYFRLFAYSGVQHIFRCVCVFVFVLVLCILCCQFLCVVPSVFANIYFPTGQY